LDNFRSWNPAQEHPMANRLKMALIDPILSLKARRWSNRRIGRELGVDSA
jgi:hypothetical protein